MSFSCLNYSIHPGISHALMGCGEKVHGGGGDKDEHVMQIEMRSTWAIGFRAGLFKDNASI